MTMHQPIGVRVEAVAPATPASVVRTLPVAPLAMPKQVLTHDTGLLRRLAVFGLTRLGWLKPGIRRVN